jgi:hypothetical protein
MKFGWQISKALLALWPILLVPGLMSLAPSTSGLWSTCTRSWFTGFLCTSVGYPLLLALFAWGVLPLVRPRHESLAAWLGWLPATLLVVPFLVAWFG